MGKKKKKPGRRGITLATIKANIRADIVAMAASVRRRIYHNPAHKTSAAILATMSAPAQSLLATFLADADMLNADLNPSSGSGQ